jgi:hypothetical protein
MATKYEIIDEIFENIYKFERLFTSGVKKEIKGVFGIKRLLGHKKETLNDTLIKLKNLECPRDYDNKTIKKLNKNVEKQVKGEIKRMIKEGEEKDNIPLCDLYEEIGSYELIAHIKENVMPIIKLLKTNKDKKDWELEQWVYISEHSIRTYDTNWTPVNTLHPDYDNYYFVYDTSSKEYIIEKS